MSVSRYEDRFEKSFTNEPKVTNPIQEARFSDIKEDEPEIDEGGKIKFYEPTGSHFQLTNRIKKE